MAPVPRRAKGRKGCVESKSPTVVCLHVTAHVRILPHLLWLLYSRHVQSHALPTQELRRIRDEEAKRDLMFLVPAALLSSVTFYHEAFTPWTALDAFFFGLVGPLFGLVGPR